MSIEREVRLGVVLYGGVSLAVYENGVAQEMFRAVKGEGVYSLLKNLIGSDIALDIVSGTSAGGINGVMLGHALANDLDFKASARLWREDGDLMKLLRKPSDPDASASLLDSRGYYQERLEACLQGMPRYLAPADGLTPADRIASPVEEFDLFVTGTDVQGHIWTAFDEQGSPIDVKEHRTCFQLSYRRGAFNGGVPRKNEFDPKNAHALAKLSRITSCFPVAFEPVQVSSSADDFLLRRWGKLDAPDKRKDIFFLDGGVLYNKPFSYALDAILRRTAERDVTRMLMYVEPDPERFEEKTSTEPPNVVQAAVDALIGIPGYQSISADLQSIAAHNDRARLRHEIMRCVAPRSGGAPRLPEHAERRSVEGDRERPGACLHVSAGPPEPTARQGGIRHSPAQWFAGPAHEKRKARGEAAGGELRPMAAKSVGPQDHAGEGDTAQIRRLLPHEASVAYVQLTQGHDLSAREAGARRREVSQAGARSLAAVESRFQTPGGDPICDGEGHRNGGYPVERFDG